MYVWLTSQNRKVHQRAMNRLVRKMNKHIENDDLWLGRFYAKQIASSWHPYEDGSGADLFVRLRFIDKKTKCTYDTGWKSVHYWSFGARLYWTMNWFIVEYCDVWRNEDPINDRIDYRQKYKEDI